MIPRALSALVFAYVNCMDDPLANDWCMTAVRIFVSVNTPSRSFACRSLASAHEFSDSDK